jgi:hypothetical protein
LKNIFKPAWPGQNDKHPFNKPVSLYVQLLKIFSKPEHQILEAFAGTCTSAEACLELGRNLVLVEKDPQQKKLFQERIALTKLKLAQTGGEDEDAEAQPLDMVEGSSKGTTKRRLTPEIRASSKKSRTESVLSQPIVEDNDDDEDEDEGEQNDEEDEEDEEERDSDIDSYASIPKSDDSSDHDFIPKTPEYPADTPPEHPADTQDSSTHEPLLESTTQERVLEPAVPAAPNPPKPRAKEPAAPNPPKPRGKGFVSLTDLAKKKSKQQKE